MKVKIIIFFLISLHLYSKEHRWVLVDHEDGLTPYSYTSSAVKDGNKLICGGDWNISGPFIKYSSNGGRNWEMILKDSNFRVTKDSKRMFVRFIFLGENDEALAILDSGYVYRTEDLKKWNRQQLKFSQTRITQDAKQYKNTILVSTSHELYKSTDFGKTWIDIYSYKQDTSNLIGIARLEVINEKIYYATYFYRNEGLINTFLMKTTDGGKTWKEITQLPSYFNQIIFTDEYTGYGHWTINDGRTQNIFKTTDGGYNWDLVYQKDFDYYNIIVSVSVYSNDTIVFVSSSKELYKTNNNFKTVEMDSSYRMLSYGKSGCITAYDNSKILNPSYDDRIYIYTDEDGFGTSVEDLPEIQNNVNNSLIFPNPSSEKIFLDLGGVAVADLVVYDILGNEIMSIPNYTNKSEIDISTLSIGTYTIQIQTSTGSIIQRFVKY